MLLLYLFLFQLVSSYKVLVYNVRFAYAHTKFMGAVADALVDGGLDVTVLLNDLDDRHQHNGTKKAKIVYVPACEESAASIRRQTDHQFCKAIWGISATNPLIMNSMKGVMEEFGTPQCRYLMARDDILERLKEEKFDVGITEVFDSCGVGLFEALGIKATVVGSSMSILETTSVSIGAPLLPSFTPGTFAQGTDSMSFWDRLENFIHVFISWDFLRYFENAQHAIFVEKYGKHFPTLSELVSKSQLVFTNSVPFLDFPRLTMRKILDIGGITYEKPKELDPEWLSILQHGPTILLSFGSVAKTIHMPEKYKLSVLEAIKRFPNVTFIWKHEEPIDQRLFQVKNIVASNWVPQNDILGHPNLTGFITHGGANSILEAAFQGKPMVIVPIFADQTRMGNQAQARGIGLLIKKEELADVEIFSNAIHQLLYSIEMKTACRRFLKLQRAADYNPGKVLSDYVKLLAEFKTLKEIQPKSAELSTFVFYGLDVLLFLLLLITMALIVIVLILQRLLYCFVFILQTKKKID